LTEDFFDDFHAECFSVVLRKLLNFVEDGAGDLDEEWMFSDGLPSG
jgi:hypothetical protein